MAAVDITLVKHFNLAVQLARDGEHAASLSAYRMIFAKAAAGTTASDEFRGTAWMRVGFCLMDLGRYEEAKTEFETMKPLLAALSKEAQYEFHFAYGNTLGKLGALDAMYSELINAVCLAEDMDDYCARPSSCWANILTHALKAKAWRFLEAKAAIAINNARLRGMTALQSYAAEMLGSARRELKTAN